MQKNISKMFQQKIKHTSFIVVSALSALEILFISKMLCFSLKSADSGEKSYYVCCNSLRHSLFAKVPLLGESTKGKQDYFSCLLSTAKGS